MSIIECFYLPFLNTIANIKINNHIIPFFQSAVLSLCEALSYQASSKPLSQALQNVI